MDEKPKRLYRSRNDKVIAGVCGGIGEYFNIDPVWIRIAAVLLAFAHGIGILAYIIAWIIIPENPNQKTTKQTAAEKTLNETVEKIQQQPKKERGIVIFGAILVILGMAFLFETLFFWFSFKYVWPFLIILLGVFLLNKRGRR